MKSPEWFHLPTACLGGIVAGTWVGWINFSHGIAAALAAGGKQAAYTFVATGLIVRLCQWLAQRPMAPVLAMALALTLPLLITMFLLFVLHSMKGTAEPLLSIVPGTTLTLVGLLIICWREREKPAAPPR